MKISVWQVKIELIQREEKVENLMLLKNENVVEKT